MNIIKKLFFIFLVLVLFFSIAIPAIAGQATLRAKKEISFPDILKVFANNGTKIIYGSTIDEKANEVNIFLPKDLRNRRFLVPIEITVVSTLDSSEAYDYIGPTIRPEKKINGKKSIYWVIPLNNLYYKSTGKKISPAEIPSGEYKINILAETYDAELEEPVVVNIITDSFIYEPPALIYGEIVSISADSTGETVGPFVLDSLVAIEDLNGNKISDFVKPTKKITQINNETMEKSIETRSFVVEVRADKIKHQKAIIHVVSEKDLYAIIDIDNSVARNQFNAENQYIVSEKTTLFYKLANETGELAKLAGEEKEDEVVEDVKEEEEITEKPEEDTVEEDMKGEEEVKEDCDIKQFASLCNLSDENVLSDIGRKFKDFLKTAVCRFQEFDLIKSVILATPDATDSSIGRGYCEYFGEKEDPNKPCEVYAQILREFKAKRISALPCPPEFCDKFKDIRPPKCFDVNDFCENDEKEVAERLNRVCRGKRCFNPPKCLDKPEKDLFCKKVDSEISSSECTEAEDFVIVEGNNGIKYCIPAKTDRSQEEIIKECELKDCHKNCGDIPKVTTPKSTPPTKPPISPVVDPPFVFPPISDPVSNPPTSTPVEPPFVLPSRLQTNDNIPLCEVEQVSTAEKPCSCGVDGVLVGGKCSCAATLKYTEDGCKRYCGTGQRSITVFPCECAKGGKFAGVIELGTVKPGKHIVELEAVIEKPGCGLGGNTVWAGDVAVRTTVNQCDSFASICSQNAIEQFNFVVQCETNENICKPRHKIELFISKETPLEFEFTSGSDCSPMKLNVYVDEKLAYTSPLLGFPGNNAGPLKIGGRGPCECPDGSLYTEKGCLEKKEEPKEPEKPKIKEEVEQCHLKCDAEAGRKIDCSNPYFEYFSIKCCDLKVPETIIITDPDKKFDTELACFGLGGASSCDAGRISKLQITGTPTLKKCLCSSKDNFNEKGFVTSEARESCRDICPEGFTQNEKGECIGKGDGKKECPKGQIRDPKTGKCIDKGIGIGGDNICPPGTGPSKTIQCVCQKPAEPGNGECKCPEGTIYAGINGCKKIEGTEGEAICPSGTGPSKTIPCKCKEPAKPIGIGSECTCEEGKVYAGEKGCIDETASEIPICGPSQFKSVIIPCKCAPGAEFNEEGLCKCLNGKEYSADGCGDVEAKICLPEENAKKIKCVCASGAKIGENGLCKCKEGEEYTTGGCKPKTTIKICEEFVSATEAKNCICAKGATFDSKAERCKCPEGQKYTKDGCGEEKSGAKVCAPDEKPSITGCTCAKGATAQVDSFCRCPDGGGTAGGPSSTSGRNITQKTIRNVAIKESVDNHYTVYGCTNVLCGENSVSTKESPCFCEGTAIAGKDGKCGCPKGEFYKPYKPGCFSRICKPGEIVDSATKCACAEGGTIGQDGKCVCPKPEQTYTEKGCRNPEHICAEDEKSTDLNPCTCASPAKLNSGVCVCPDAEFSTYTGKGCVARPHTCKKGEVSSELNPCTCTSPAKLNLKGICECSAGETYSELGCKEATICQKGEKTTTGCTCASGATESTDGTCACKSGENYTVHGCTTVTCSVGQASRADSPCACKGTATPTGLNGECVCPNGAEYSLTFGGCGD